MTYDKGKRFRVIKPGPYLSGLKHVGGSAFQGTRQDLNVGDVIESNGYIGGWGSDNIDVANFTLGEFRGEFQPNSWGIPVKGYLEEIV